MLDAAQPSPLATHIMPFFSDSSYVDIRGSHLTDIAGNQTIVNGNLTIICLERPAALEIRTPVTQSSKAVSSTDTVIGLIIEIVQSLMDPCSPNGYRNLKQSFESLQDTVVLAVLVVQAYEGTPLGRGLAKVINREMGGCVMVLQQLRETINTYLQVPKSSRVGYVLHNLWGHRCEPDEIASMRGLLRIRQRSLDECLNAVNSYVSVVIHVCHSDAFHRPTKLRWLLG